MSQQVHGADSKVLVSYVNRFHNSVVDLRPGRTVHSVLRQPCNAASSIDCKTVHFGFCTPVDVYILRDDSNISSSLTSSDPRSDGMTSPRSSSSLGDFNLDSIDLLAADVHSNLQALVSSFVARDKINQRFAKNELKNTTQLPTNASGINSNSYPNPGTDYDVVHEVPGAQSDPDLILSATLEDIEKETGVAENSAKLMEGAKIIRRHKKKPCTIDDVPRTVTDQVIRKCEELISDIGPLNKPQKRTSSAVDYAKKLLENQATETYRHQVKCDNGISAPSNQMVTKAKLRWESPHPNSSIQQQMFNVLGIGCSSSNLHRASGEPTPSIPHPKLTSTQKQHIRDRSFSPTGQLFDGSGSNPVTPFLTKGSVAERVLLFEKAPEMLVLDKHLPNSRIRPATWRNIGSHDYLIKLQSHKERDKENRGPQLQIFPTKPSYQTVRRGLKSRSNIPQFYFPKGRPLTSNEIEVRVQKISDVFRDHPNGLDKHQFGNVALACGLSLYWKTPLFLAASRGKVDLVSKDCFVTYWRRIMSTCNDLATKFVQVLSNSTSSHLIPDDFTSLIQDIVETHPGLTFLKEATEFHSRYINTVIARIYYCVNRSWTGRITIPELRKSNFLQILAILDDESDINQITEYFSYEHFYVIYCKFWELDKDHDLLIDKSDLGRHNDHSISSRMIDRLFSGCVTRDDVRNQGKMSYSEFVWFLISEEDKRHSTSIEYWFRCMDLDGDGILSMYELEYFYEEQLQRMESLEIETLPFQDCLCQMLDLVRPKKKNMITLSDLKRCKMTPVFFDTFFNLEKYLDHEQRDPFASQRDHECEGLQISDWERYAAEEYELLVAEEGDTDHQEDLIFENIDINNIDDFVPGMSNKSLNSADNSTSSGTYTNSAKHFNDPDYTEPNDFS